MASNAKPALVFMLLLATVMAASACTNCPKYVSCKNEYCKPIKVNGVVVDADVTLDVLVDVTGLIVLEVTDLSGKVVTGTYTCPSDATALVFVQVGLGIAVKVLASVTTSLVGTVLAILDITLDLCVNIGL
jgi:hypothetical protein